MHGLTADKLKGIVNPGFEYLLEHSVTHIVGVVGSPIPVGVRGDRKAACAVNFLVYPFAVGVFEGVNVRGRVELFGFGSNEERTCFNQLISVSGVGPKAAMSILSTMTPDRFSLAVCSEDIKAISNLEENEILISAKTKENIDELKNKISRIISGTRQESFLLKGIVKPDEFVVLVKTIVAILFYIMYFIFFILSSSINIFIRITNMN